MSDLSFDRRISQVPIAIVGMASVFPQSPNLKGYWKNILAEADCITEVPPNRFSLDDYYDPNPAAPDKVYCKQGGFMPDLDFNPLEFGLPPNILEVTDVAQLWALMMTKEALKDAGYGEGLKDWDRVNTGCILGVGGGQKLLQPLISRMQYPVWKRVLSSVGIAEADQGVIIERMKKAYVRWEENSFPGTLGNVIAGRVANRFDLGATNCVVDAACASSLAGVRMALSELTEGRANMMITGGVDTDNSIHMFMCFSKTPAFTKKDKVRPFDEDSAGIMIGEGIGFLILKRLEDARRDGDKVYAVIKGTGSSSDGRFKSIYAPRSEGQLLALKRAYLAAEVDPKTVGLWEAHGTGTKAGDAAEVNALHLFYGDKAPGQSGIALGSVKSQMGHTKNAAGAAGLIKAALALQHKVLPGHINVTKPNPELRLDQSPLYINAKTRPWFARPDGAPRRAGVSAFGFGGTNFHFVLEEANPEPQFRLHEVAQELLFHAPTPEALKTQLRQALGQLAGEAGELAFWERAEASKTLTIPPSHARLGLVAENALAAAQAVQAALDAFGKEGDQPSWSLNSGVAYAHQAVTGKVAALFSGQGSPYLNMGLELALNFAPFRQCFEEMDVLMAAQGRPGISNLVFPEPAFTKEDLAAQEQTLQLTENAQPAIGCMALGLYRILAQGGFQPDMAAGHSFGELMALAAAGVISESSALKLAKARGEAMQALPGVDAGGMLAVVGKVENLPQDLAQFPEVVLANLNSRNQVVAAGPKAALAQAAEHLKGLKYTVKPLSVSAAFHTPLVSHAQGPFAAAISQESFQAPAIPVFSNALAKPHSNSPSEIQEELQAHILNPVRFTEEIIAMHDAGARIFVECGPQGILSKLVDNILEGKDHLCIALNGNAKQPADRQLREAVIRLKVAGLRLGQIDPLADRPRPEPVAPNKMAIKINGMNYVSPATAQAYEQALAEPYQVAGTTIITERIMSDSPKANLDQALAGLETNLARLHEQQAQTLALHQQFLQNQAEYSRTVQQLVNQPGSEQALANLQSLHQHQGDTLRVHEQYLTQQAEFSRNAFHLIQGQQAALSGQAAPLAVPPAAPTVYQPAPAAPRPIATQVPIAAPMPHAPVERRTEPRPQAAPSPRPAPAAPMTVPSAHKPVAAAGSEIQAALLAVVAEKTGYAAEMLELGMDMEADLGIDSIKRVEILYGIQEKLPSLPPINQEDLAPLRSLQEILTYLTSRSASPVAAAPAAKASQTSAPVATGTSASAAQAALLAVVAEKTGYAAEMLELGMDMEADLGIDSIKRVEILYGIQEKLPSLPPINQEDLAPLRSLGQILDYLLSLGGATPPASAPAAKASQPSTPAVAGTSASAAQAALLAVVAEKTGYAAEMLELSMDMEADLGIDSIKRVEILYGIQEKLPSLPPINQEDLAPLRSLGQILDYLLNLGGAKSPASAPAAKASQPSAPAVAGTSASAAQAALLAVVAEKTGYAAEMLELSMDMEADLGIDSIKRVEILYGIQEKLPSLPPINQEDLAPLRSLGQILDYLLQLGGAAAPANPVSPAPSLGQKKKSELRGWRKRVYSKELGQPDQLLFTPGKRQNLILTYSGTESTAALAAALQEKGWNQISILRLPSDLVAGFEHLPGDLEAIQLTDTGEQAIAEAVAEFRKLGPITGLIHLEPPRQGEGWLPSQEQSLKALFYLAKHVQPDLEEAAQSGRAALMVASQMDGLLGTGRDHGFGLWQGGFAGLVKSCKAEWPEVFCRLVDFGPQISAAEQGRLLAQELYDPAQALLEVGYGPQGRMTLTSHGKDLKPDTPPLALQPQDLILVSGGAKGVTATCVKALAAASKASFLLLGRSPAPAPEPAWALGVADDKLQQAAMLALQAQGDKPTPMAVQNLLKPILAGREIEASLQEIAQAGGKAQYLSLDITDLNACQEALREFPGITGLIHGAGVLADKRIEKKEPADLEKVFNAKVIGLQNLLASLDERILTYVGLFSSSAGFYGNVGQSDYAAANEILNKFAYQFKAKHPQAQVHSFNWGPWDGGMVTDSLKRHFQAKGVRVIPQEVGAELLVQEFSPALADTVQIVIGDSMVTAPSMAGELKAHLLRRRIGVEEHPWLKDHAIGGKAVLPMVFAMSWMAETAKGLYPGFHLQSLQDVAVLKGITLGAEAEDFALEIHELEKSAQGLTLQMKLLSQVGGKTRYHYQAKLHLGLAAGAAPKISCDLAETNPLPGQGFYAQGVLFHGPSLQMIQGQLNQSPQRLTLKALAPRPAQPGRFVYSLFNPFAEDGLLQALLVQAHHLTGLPSLPLKLAQAEFFHPAPCDRAFFITLEVESQSSGKLTATVSSHNAQGRVYARFTGAEVTLSEKLKGKF